MNTGLKPAWAGRALRLDPTHLPQYVTYAVKEETGIVSVTLEQQGVVIKRRLRQSRLPFTIALPARAFMGVAARAVEDENFNVIVTLELMHADPAFSVPLLVSSDLCDIEADWRAWAKAYDLPLMMVEADGMPYPLNDRMNSRQEGAEASPSGKKRRSLFQMRRTGKECPGLRMTIGGAEIIAGG